MSKKKQARTKAEIAADKRRTGRPRKISEDKQREKITVYLTTAERRRLEALAKKEGTPLAVLIMRPWREKKG